MKSIKKEKLKEFWIGSLLYLSVNILIITIAVLYVNANDPSLLNK